MLRLKKSLGQHFLMDENILRKEVAIASVRGKTVLEIGAGDGRLTEKILEGKPKRVIAIEKDSRFAEILRKRFAGEKAVEIVNDDFLRYVPHSSIDIIIGNIPYYISAPIIFRLRELKFKKAIVMVQQEFAEKMAAAPNSQNYGRLSVTSQLFFKVKIIQRVPQHLFTPPPKVDSAIVELQKQKIMVNAHDERIINLLFQHRNKTVRNALLSGKIERNRLEKLGKILERRVRTLTKEECLQLSALLP